MPISFRSFCSIFLFDLFVRSFFSFFLSIPVNLLLPRFYFLFFYTFLFELLFPYSTFSLTSSRISTIVRLFAIFITTLTIQDGRSHSRSIELTRRHRLINSPIMRAIHCISSQQDMISYLLSRDFWFHQREKHNSAAGNVQTNRDMDLAGGARK